MKKVYLFGAGSFGQRAVDDVSPGTCKVLGFIDNNPALRGSKIKGYSVYGADDLSTLDYDYIVITSTFCSEIKRQLIELGIEPQKIKIYNEDFPSFIGPDAYPVIKDTEPHNEVMRLLLGESIFKSKNWENLPAEKTILLSFLRTIRPKCAIEIGTYLGGSLRVISEFSKKVYSLDVDPNCKLSLSGELPNTEFVIGPSQETLPRILDIIDNTPGHPELEFVLVDGDHTGKGIQGDLEALLKYKPKKDVIVLLHDVANPDCRQGMLNVDWDSFAHLHYVNLDFVPGILHYLVSCYREMWGGFGVLLLRPEEREGTVEIRCDLPQHYDALYNGSFHSAKQPNPFRANLVPFIRGKGNPLLTVGIPNFNHGNIIETAIEAITSQSYPPDEIIICDDGSTDDSWERLLELKNKFPEIQLLRNETNEGVFYSLNKLVSKAKGDYVYLGAADDRVMPFFFENMLSLLAQYPAAGLAMSAFIAKSEETDQQWFNHVSRWTLPGYYCPQACLQDYFEIEAPQHSLSTSTIYKTSILRKVGCFRPELGHWADTFAIRAIAAQHGTVYSPQVGTIFCVRKDSFSGKQIRDFDTSRLIIEKAAEAFQEEQLKPFFPKAHVDLWKERSLEVAKQLSGFGTDQ